MTLDLYEEFRALVRAIDEGKDHLTLDLLLAEGPLEDIWDMRMQVEADDEVVSTVTREGLIRMKSLSGRLKDMADIEQLEENDG